MSKRPDHRIKKGVLWSALERFSSQGIQFVVSMVLARILMPADYGIIAMAMILLVILQAVSEMGFGAALLHKLDRDALDFSTVFVFNIFLGLFLYGCVFFSAPAIALFFDEPMLVPVMRWLGLNLVINSFIGVQQALLLIRVDFKALAKASVTAAIVSGGIAVYLAYIGWGVMALVAQSILFSLINVSVIYAIVRYFPAFRFSYTRFKPLFDYTYKLLGTRLLNTLFDQGYPFVIGKIYSPTLLGYFNRAQSFQGISSNNICQIVQRVSLPLLCEAQHDSRELGRVLIKFIRISAVIVFPLIFGIFMLAEPLVVTILTEKWLYTAHILKFISPIGLLLIFGTFNRNLFNATGKTGWAFQSELIKKIVFTAVMLITVFISFEALLIGQIVIAVIDFIISAFYTKKQIGLTIWDQIRSVGDIFLASTVMSLVIYVSILPVEGDLMKLIVGTISGIITYFSVCYFFNIMNIREEMKRFIKRILHKNS